MYANAKFASWGMCIESEKCELSILFYFKTVGIWCYSYSLLLNNENIKESLLVRFMKTFV